MIKAIFFDYNGVIARQTTTREEQLSELLGIPIDDIKSAKRKMRSDQSIQKLFDLISDFEGEKNYHIHYVRELCKELGIQSDIQLETTFINLVREVTRFELFPETMPTLRKLQDHFKIGILSNAMPSRRHADIISKGLGELIDPDMIILSTEIGHSKPEPEIFVHAAKRASVAISEIIHVDDKMDYAQKALSAGVGKAFFVGSEIDPASRVTTIKNLSELPEYLS